MGEKETVIEAICRYVKKAFLLDITTKPSVSSLASEWRGSPCPLLGLFKTRKQVPWKGVLTHTHTKKKIKQQRSLYLILQPTCITDHHNLTSSTLCQNNLLLSSPRSVLRGCFTHHWGRSKGCHLAHPKIIHPMRLLSLDRKLFTALKGNHLGQGHLYRMRSPTTSSWRSTMYKIMASNVMFRFRYI